jgi:hypothetical protein
VPASPACVSQFDSSVKKASFIAAEYYRRDRCLTRSFSGLEITGGLLGPNRKRPPGEFIIAQLLRVT